MNDWKEIQDDDYNPANGDRYSAPAEDRLLFGICAGITLGLIAAICAVVHYAPAIDLWRLF